MKRLLVLGGSEFQIPLLKRAKDLGYYVGLIDMNADASARPYADVFYQSSLKDKAGVLEYAKSFNPDGITVGMVDVAVPTCAYITTKLQLPGMDEETAKRATDKYEMIKAFQKYNVPHPHFLYVPKEKRVTNYSNVNYPVIVKPVDMAGSRGIYLANNKVELEKAVINSSLASDRGDVIIEEYMDGPEVSVELVVKNGEPFVIQVTDKTTSGAPHFAETGHLQPSQLSDEIIEKIKEVACNAAKSLNLKNSLGHAEIKVTSNGPKMVEIGARAGGDGIAEQLIELSTGVSFSEIAIQIAMGNEITIPNTRLNRASCIRFILSQNGILRSVKGIETVNKMNNIHEIKIYGDIGKNYHEMVDNSGRIGYIIASADCPEEAKDACDEAMRHIDVEFD